MGQQLLRISAVARLLSVSESSTRRLIRKNVIPSIRIGRQIRVDPESLREWLRRGGAGAWKRSISGDDRGTA